MPDDDGCRGERRRPTILDLRGLKCPLPVLITRKALAQRSAGDLIEVVSTDPLAGLDIPNLVRETGDELVAARVEGRDLRFSIRRRSRVPFEARPSRTGATSEDPSVPPDVDSTQHGDI